MIYWKWSLRKVGRCALLYVSALFSLFFSGFDWFVTRIPTMLDRSCLADSGSICYVLVPYILLALCIVTYPRFVSSYMP